MMGFPWFSDKGCHGGNCCDQVAPRYVPSGVRVMVYFRLQLSLPVDVSFKTHRNETCKEVSWRKRLVPE